MAGYPALPSLASLVVSVDKENNEHGRPGVTFAATPDEIRSNNSSRDDLQNSQYSPEVAPLQQRLAGLRVVALVGALKRRRLAAASPPSRELGGCLSPTPDDATAEERGGSRGH